MRFPIAIDPPAKKVDCKNLVTVLSGPVVSLIDHQTGMGMASALGVSFLDTHGKPVSQGGGALADVKQISMEGLDPRIADTEILVACDVTNPLSGPQGASFVYGPQKGADSEMVEGLDKNLSQLARLISPHLTGKFTDDNKI